MKTASYTAIFFLTLIALFFLQPVGGYIVQAEVVNTVMALLFVLLVWLITRLLGTGGTARGIWGTAALTLLLCPGWEDIMERSIESVLAMGSLCIVPFFINQYKRVREKDFKWAYFIMFFMGIFCSYTHPGISIPLCLSFLTMAYSERGVFFRRACWPMVIGTVIGTTATVMANRNFGTYSFQPQQMERTTAYTLLLLWNTKSFLAAMGITIWCLSTHRWRRTLQATYIENRLLGYCLLYSLAIIPFAPIGVDFAVEGVSLFGMFWVMLLGHSIVKFDALNHRFSIKATA